MIGNCAISEREGWAARREVSLDEIETGLIKVCPRCGAKGAIYVAHDGRGYLVRWKRRSEPKRPVDAVGLAELIRPAFGCGYDNQIRYRIVPNDVRCDVCGADVGVPCHCGSARAGAVW